jgi:hypothetical protein
LFTKENAYKRNRPYPKSYPIHFGVRLRRKNRFVKVSSLCADLRRWWLRSVFYLYSCESGRRNLPCSYQKSKAQIVAFMKSKSTFSILFYLRLDRKNNNGAPPEREGFEPNSPICSISIVCKNSFRLVNPLSNPIGRGGHFAQLLDLTNQI